MTSSLVQIIYLNGPSSSGKTSLAKALQDAFEKPFLHIGIDKIIAWMPEKVNDWSGKEQSSPGYSWKRGEDVSGNLIQELQIGPYGRKIAKTFQDVVFMLAKKGHYLIIDDVSFGKKQVDEWKELLKNFKVLWIGVNAPLDVLEQREKERGNRMVGSARGQFHKVHLDTTYDLEIDTYYATLSENVAKIQSLMASKDIDQRILIRLLQEADILKIIDRYSYPWSTPEKTKMLWNTYYQEHQNGIRTVAVVEEGHNILGYGSLLRKPECPFFLDGNIPEINAVWIDKNRRKQGLGTALIKWLEDLASHEGYNQIGIGVGLYRDYGPAQQLYFQLGYSPDGNGITYKGQPTIAGQTYPLDDDLLLWLVKALR